MPSAVPPATQSPASCFADASQAASPAAAASAGNAEGAGLAGGAGPSTAVPPAAAQPQEPAAAAGVQQHGKPATPPASPGRKPATLAELFEACPAMALSPTAAGSPLAAAGLGSPGSAARRQAQSAATAPPAPAAAPLESQEALPDVRIVLSSLGLLTPSAGSPRSPQAASPASTAPHSLAGIFAPHSPGATGTVEDAAAPVADAAAAAATAPTGGTDGTAVRAGAGQGHSGGLFGFWTPDSLASPGALWAPPVSPASPASREEAGAGQQAQPKRSLGAALAAAAGFPPLQLPDPAEAANSGPAAGQAPLNPALSPALPTPPGRPGYRPFAKAASLNGQALSPSPPHPPPPPLPDARALSPAAPSTAGPHPPPSPAMGSYRPLGAVSTRPPAAAVALPQQAALSGQLRVEAAPWVPAPPLLTLPPRDQAPPGTELALAASHPGLSNAAGEYNCFLNVIIQCLWRCADFRAQVGDGVRKGPAPPGTLRL